MTEMTKGFFSQALIYDHWFFYFEPFLARFRKMMIRLCVTIRQVMRFGCGCLNIEPLAPLLTFQILFLESRDYFNWKFRSLWAYLDLEQAWNFCLSCANYVKTPSNATRCGQAALLIPCRKNSFQLKISTLNSK